MIHLVDGVSSGARMLPALDGRDLTVVRSEEPYLFGDDSRRYVDTALGFGGSILGHADPAVVAAAAAALRAGPLPAFPHPRRAGDRGAGAAHGAARPRPPVRRAERRRRDPLPTDPGQCRPPHARTRLSGARPGGCARHGALLIADEVR